MAAGFFTKHRLIQAVLIIVVAGLIGCSPPATYKKSNAPTGKPLSERKLIKNRMRELFQLYEQKNTMRLMGLLDNTFYGSRYQFENNLEAWLKTVDSIQFDYYIEQISSASNTLEVRFNWDRRWRNINTRSIGQSSGQTTFRFIKRKDSYFIQQIRGTNPFF